MSKKSAPVAIPKSKDRKFSQVIRVTDGPALFKTNLERLPCERPIPRRGRCSSAEGTKCEGPARKCREREKEINRVPAGDGTHGP
jgi:hypothetical protein